MADYILVDGDKAEFMPNFGAALVVTRLGILEAGGPATFTTRRFCVDGDEKKVAVRGCPYTTPLFPIPGVGTLKIAALAPDQKATKSHSGELFLMLRGSRFVARFEVDSPAMQAPLLIPDPTPQYSGQGQFLTTNTKFRAT